jgi:hypothetical protein
MDRDVWDDVRAELDAQRYAGQPLDGRGLILHEVLNVAQEVLLTHVAAGTIDEEPLLEVKVVDAPGGGQGLALYVRGEHDPRWTT